MQPIIQILSQVQTLVSRLTGIASLDKADSNASSVVPASTALSASTWTGAKVVLLDSNISTIATAASANTASATVYNTLLQVDDYLSNLLTSIVKGSQSGYLGTVINTYNATAGLREYYADVALSAVSDTSKCLVLLNGFFVDAQFSLSHETPNYSRVTYPMGYLTSTTNLRLSCFAYQDSRAVSFGAANASVRWTVIEFF